MLFGVGLRGTHLPRWYCPVLAAWHLTRRRHLCDNKMEQDASVTARRHCFFHQTHPWRTQHELTAIHKQTRCYPSVVCGVCCVRSRCWRRSRRRSRARACARARCRVGGVRRSARLDCTCSTRPAIIHDTVVSLPIREKPHRPTPMERTTTTATVTNARRMQIARARRTRPPIPHTHNQRLNWHQTA